MLVGSYAGNRLGAIRDAKGKSVAQVFSSLGGSQKAEVSCFNLYLYVLSKHRLLASRLDSSCPSNESIRNRRYSVIRRILALSEFVLLFHFVHLLSFLFHLPT